MSISDIWIASDAFNRFRGDGWMQEPCRSCPEKIKDFGGCRCQAYLMTGDMHRTDPVCGLSPDRRLVDQIIADAGIDPEQPLVFRNPKKSRELAGTKPH